MHALCATGRVACDAGVPEEAKRLDRMRGRTTTTAIPPDKTGITIEGATLIKSREMDEAIRKASLHPTVLAPR